MELISREEAMRLLKEDYDASRSRGDDERAEVCLLHFIDISNLPAVEERKEGKWTKFYYVESIDDYWIGEDLGDDCTLYYEKWDNKLGFVFSASRYLPWGEHVVSPTSLWKEYTYPSEPKEIPFTEWIMGFVKKYFKGE